MPLVHNSNITFGNRILQAAIDVRTLLGSALFVLSLIVIFAVMLPYAAVEYLLHKLQSRKDLDCDNRDRAVF